MNTVSLIYIIQFLDLFAVGLTFPLFSNHLRSLGSTHFIIGLIESTYSGVQILSGPLIGGWSDVRDRKTVLKSTLLLCGICYGLLGLTNSVPFIFFLRFLLGGIKHTQSICKAVITDVVPLKDQSVVFGRSVAFASVGFIAGPILGGHLSEFKNGFCYVCLSTTLLFVLNYIFASKLPDSTKKPKPQHNIFKTILNEFHKSSSDLKSINWSIFWDSFLIRFLFGLTMTCYFKNQALFLKEKYALSTKQVGYMISYYSSIGTIFGFALNYIDKMFRDGDCLKKLSSFFAIMSFSFIAIFMSNNLWLFYGLIVPMSISSTCLRVTSMEYMIKKADKNNRGLLSGASNSVMSVSRFIAPIYSGVFSDLFSQETVILSAFVPSLMGTGLTCYLWIKSGKKKVKSS